MKNKDKSTACNCTPDDHCGCMDNEACLCGETAEVDTLCCETLHCGQIICDNIDFASEREENSSAQVLVRDEAPDFIAPAVMPDNQIEDDFHLYEYLEDSYGLIIFYPADFTFVCPSELIAFNHRLKEFEKRGVKLLGISVDSPYAHQTWKKMPASDGGVGPLDFPLISDQSKEISEAYGVLSEDGVALRASFLLDKEGIVRHQLINDLPLGRDVDEALRIIDALLFYEEHGEVCPANWKRGKEGITPTSAGIAQYLNKNLDQI